MKTGIRGQGLGIRAGIAALLEPHLIEGRKKLLDVDPHTDVTRYANRELPEGKISGDVDAHTRRVVGANKAAVKS